MILSLLNLEFLEELFQEYLYHLLKKDLLKELKQIKLDIGEYSNK